ncbi:hypothetical protein A4V15_24360 [Pseudomonas oryzihabitans]|uniref:Uncharacterized protein n=1 Tax=Pseudomonas oryzihabitans TaxID=47885 RepID=A0A178L3P9_9PSED|nr:hypothetical protein A4V15_24360 [Pseudomonas oryzihabitans]
MLGFPSLQSLVVAALSLDDFTGFRVFIALQRTHPALLRNSRGTIFATRIGTAIRIQDCNNVPERFAVLAEQSAQFLLEFELFLQTLIAIKLFQALLEFFNCSFGLTVFLDQGHRDLLEIKR